MHIMLTVSTEFFKVCQSILALSVYIMELLLYMWKTAAYYLHWIVFWSYVNEVEIYYDCTLKTSQNLGGGNISDLK